VSARTFNKTPIPISKPNAVQFQSQDKNMMISELHSDFDEHTADEYQR
jgi:hypothetical protein